MKRLWEKYSGIRPWFWFFGYLLVFPDLTIWIANCRGLHMFDLENLLIAALLTVSGLFLFAVFGCFGSPRFGRTVMLVACVLAGTFHFLDLFFFVHFQSQTRLSFWFLARATNWTEVLGFIHFYLLNGKTVLLLLAYPASGLLFAVFLKRKFVAAGFAAWILAGPLLLNFALSLRPDAENNRYGVMTLPVLIDRFLEEKLDAEFMADDLAAANAELKAVSREESAVYVLVIGESHSKYHSSLYGYPRRTMPRMEELAARNELYVFRDVTAPNSFTNNVLPKLLSFEAHDVDEKFFEVPNIIDLMRAAGFRTWYLSNQANASELGLTYMAIAARADVFRNTMTVWKSSPDEALLPLFDEALADPAPRKFIILHLIGSHSSYEATYPASFRRFPLDEAPEFFNAQQKQNREIVNHYDNSVLYNDFILDTLISRLRRGNPNGFLLYLPDHGENLYEEKDTILHMEFMPTRQTVEVPMLLYLTDAYRAAMRPGEADEIARGTARPWSSEDLPFLLLELGRIEYDGFQPEKSPINPQFRPKTRIVSKCRILYDKLKNATCEERISARDLR